jgi:hypothetical protein
MGWFSAWLVEVKADFTFLYVFKKLGNIVSSGIRALLVDEQLLFWRRDRGFEEFADEVS